MIMLVTLRLVIGWHFFKEGLSHRFDANWSSEGFLKQAKGPLADHYQADLPTFHHWDVLVLGPMSEQELAAKDEATAKADAAAEKAAADEPPANDAKQDDAKSTDAKASAKKPTAPKAKAEQPDPVYAEWLRGVSADWTADREKFDTFYGLDKAQQAKSADVLKHSAAEMVTTMNGHAPDIRLYRELVARARQMPAAPGGREVPFLKARAASVEKNPLGEVGLTGTSAVLSEPPPHGRPTPKGSNSSTTIGSPNCSLPSSKKWASSRPIRGCTRSTTSSFGC